MKPWLAWLLFGTPYIAFCGWGLWVFVAAWRR